MPWAVTLKVTECATNANIAGAFITDGTVTYYTDSYGQLIVIIHDAYHTYFVQIGKSGYITKTCSLNRGTMEGTTVTQCLDEKPPSSGGGGGGGGW